MKQKLNSLILLALPFAIAPGACAWGMTLYLETSVDNPAPIGTAIRWTATVSDAKPGTLWYRFRIRPPASTAFQTARDFSETNTFDWFPAREEGQYAFEVSVRHRESGETTAVTASFNVLPRATSTPVITPTNHELVFLYSAPPCPSAALIRVEYAGPEGSLQSTPSMMCTNGRSINTYLAGLRAHTTYKVHQVVMAVNGQVTTGPELELTTGDLRWTAKSTKAVKMPAGNVGQGLLLQSKLAEYTTATDLEGNTVWYCPLDIRYLTRPLPGGGVIAIIDPAGSDESQQMVRELDVACNIVLETNATQINEQLAVMGVAPITSFHHEARLMPGGKLLLLAGSERILSNVQGEGEVDVIGDTIIVLNRSMRVEWAWDSFDHIDVRRAAVMGETCGAGTGGCPEIRLRKVGNDWLHGNSLQLTPDGHILYSARHQDWVIKINYDNGNGNGDVLWRLGKDGDFRLASGNPDDWFSHQHDANYEPGSAHSRILLFDNGNTRQSQDSSAHSRGQVWEIDEATRTARLVLNVDLGEYARALGSAQKLDNGNYHFNVGWTPDSTSRAVEFTPDGQLVTDVRTDTQQYRSFRMKDLYTMP